MSIETAADLQGMKRIGRIVASVLDAARRAVRAGMTTRELDALCGRELDRLGARSTPQHEYGFPGVACLSVNDEVVHGVGGDRRLGDGDVVKIDRRPTSTAPWPTPPARS